MVNLELALGRECESVENMWKDKVSFFWIFENARINLNLNFSVGNVGSKLGLIKGSSLNDVRTNLKKNWSKIYNLAYSDKRNLFKIIFCVIFSQ